MSSSSAGRGQAQRPRSWYLRSLEGALGPVLVLGEWWEGKRSWTIGSATAFVSRGKQEDVLVNNLQSIGGLPGHPFCRFTHLVSGVDSIQEIVVIPGKWGQGDDVLVGAFCCCWRRGVTRAGVANLLALIEWPRTRRGQPHYPDLLYLS
jgi:hypothetical protein